MLERMDDTIVAISSAPGHGLLGIVRLSGPKAIDVACRMAVLPAGDSLASQPASTRTLGEVLFEAELSLPAWFYLFRAPHSYTRQDLVEIHTVGSPPVLESVRRRAIELGAVPAEPGEFTARAFLNGAMDLAAAEAVAAVIRARSDTQLRAAHRMMDSSFTQDLSRLGSDLAGLLALVEADIDFSQEPIEFVTPAELQQRLRSIAQQLQQLRQGSASAERFDGLPCILLVGLPNAGKSSLMNRLSGTSRAICHATSGTTRDLLSAAIKLGNSEAILLDSAGVDRSPNAIMAQAMTLTRSAAQHVDLVCFVVDLSEAVDDQLCDWLGSLHGRRIVTAANKLDLVSPSRAREVSDQLTQRYLGPVCTTSAVDGTGIEALRSVWTDLLSDVTATTLGQCRCLSRRQWTSIGRAHEALQRALSLSETVHETIDCADVLAFELREALEAIASVTGEVTTEELLEQVFANFCIGK